MLEHEATRCAGLRCYRTESITVSCMQAAACPQLQDSVRRLYRAGAHLAVPLSFAFCSFRTCAPASPGSRTDYRQSNTVRKKRWRT